MASVRQEAGKNNHDPPAAVLDSQQQQRHHRIHEDGNDDQEQQQQQQQPPSRMGQALERGGILGYGSYLTFAWAGSFLELGSTVTLKEEHLETIYKTFKRCVWFGLVYCTGLYGGLWAK